MKKLIVSLVVLLFSQLVAANVLNGLPSFGETILKEQFPEYNVGQGLRDYRGPPMNSDFDLVIKIGDLIFYSSDVALLIFCPLGAALGVLVSFAVKEKKRNPNSPKLSITRKFGIYIGTVFSGLVLGLMIALFFVGAMANEVTALARVVALSVLLGYQARYLWESQENVISNLIDKELEKKLNSFEKSTKLKDE